MVLLRPIEHPLSDEAVTAFPTITTITQSPPADLLLAGNPSLLGECSLHRGRQCSRQLPEPPSRRTLAPQRLFLPKGLPKPLNLDIQQSTGYRVRGSWTQP